MTKKSLTDEQKAKIAAKKQKQALEAKKKAYLQFLLDKFVNCVNSKIHEFESLTAKLEALEIPVPEQKSLIDTEPGTKVESCEEKPTNQNADTTDTAVTNSVVADSTVTDKVEEQAEHKESYGSFVLSEYKNFVDAVGEKVAMEEMKLRVILSKLGPHLLEVEQIMKNTNTE